jgi:hypothetical protein
MIKGSGVIIFVVFNKNFIEDNLNNNIFSHFKNFRTGFIELKEGIKVPVYNRTEVDYRNLFASRGFNEIYIDYPPFTKDFLSKYDMPFATDEPEYLIQAFRKKINKDA